MISRDKFVAELKLREQIKKIIESAASVQQNRLLQENKLRKVIRKLIKEESDTTPHASTGINVLEDLLKKVIPTLETDYKQLTSEKNQRDSFRAHIINAVQNTLAPTQATEDAGKALPGLDEILSEEGSLDEADIDVTVDDPETPDENEFIDIEKKPSDDQELEDFGLPGKDETGRNFAAKTFDKVGKQIEDAYRMLASDEDRELFYDYLLTNLKLYFDKFEDELQTSLPEPTTPEYEKEKDNTD